MKHKKKHEVSKTKEFLVFGIAVVSLVIYLNTKQQLLNYPEYLTSGLTVFAFCILITIGWRRTVDLLLKKDYLSIVGIIIRNLLIGFVIAATLLIPFNLYLNASADQHPAIQTCLPLLKVTTYNRNRCFFYKYNNETYVYYDYKPIMQKIESENNPFDYCVDFKIKQGKLGIFKILKWDIVKRNKTAN